jgi:hypothetical protein
MERSTRDPAEHIATLPDPVRADIERLDAAISEVMAGTTRTLWEGRFWGGSEQTIIGYGDYSYRRSDGETVEWFVVGLAAQKRYISVYVNAVEGDRYLAETYADSLGKAKVGRSNISFKALADIDLDALLGLVARARELTS